jgi:hypothetical protein
VSAATTLAVRLPKVALSQVETSLNWSQYRTTILEGSHTSARLVGVPVALNLIAPALFRKQMAPSSSGRGVATAAFVRAWAAASQSSRSVMFVRPAGQAASPLLPIV